MISREVINYQPPGIHYFSDGTTYHALFGVAMDPMAAVAGAVTFCS